jgi:glutamyl-tRNA synthetase
MIELMKDRAVLLPDFVDLTEFFFKAPTTFDEKFHAKCWTPETGSYLKTLAERYAQLPVFDAVATEKALRDLALEFNIPAGKILLPLRLAVTGLGQGPSLFHFIEILGQQETVKRLNYLLDLA